MESSVRRLIQASVIGATLSACTLSAGAQSSHPVGGSPNQGTPAFRWITVSSDSATWARVKSAFRDELRPDDPKSLQAGEDAYRYKFVEKVAAQGDAALVIIGQRVAERVSAKDEWNRYDTAYNFDLETGKKSAIETTTDLWHWRFRGSPVLGPTHVPDVTFSYLTCTECEPDYMLGAFYFDSTKSNWQPRSWAFDKELWWAAKDGLVVDMDLTDKDDVLSYDCAYGTISSKTAGFKDIGIRCKEVFEDESGKTKIEDYAAIFGAESGTFKGRRISEFSEMAALNHEICRAPSDSLLCKLPVYVTLTSGQNAAIDEIFPGAITPKTRAWKDFQSLRSAMTMREVVQKFGRPDELGGSGINIFIYDLDDGSLVAIGAIDEDKPILYATHTTRSGKSSSILSTK